MIYCCLGFFIFKFFMQYVLILYFPLLQLLLDHYPLNFIFLFLSLKKENEWQIINSKFKKIIINKTCTSSSQKKSQHGEGEVNTRHKIPALMKKLFATDTWWERENQFSTTSDTGYINHTPGQAPYSGIAGQHKVNPICKFLLNTKGQQ